MSAHKKAYKTVDANGKADKKAGIFHFNEGSKRERRREEYKELFGEHLISMCAAGNLFSTFTNFANKMETLRQMTESAALMEEGGATAEARSRAYDDIEEEFSATPRLPTAPTPTRKKKCDGRRTTTTAWCTPETRK
jgi:hypothetical protein